MHHRLLTALAFVLLTAGAAHADLDTFLGRLDVSVRADLGAFRTELGTHFEATPAQIDVIFRSVERPAEAAVCLWLCERTGRPVADVLYAYRVHRKNGWGSLAKSLGIKPGSADFKALKRGDLGWPAAGRGKGKGGGGKHRH